MTSASVFERDMLHRRMRFKGDDEEFRMVYVDSSRSVFANFSTEEVCKQQLEHFAQDYALSSQCLDDFVPNTESVQKDIKEWLAMGCSLEQLLDTIKKTHNYGGVSLISEESVMKYHLTNEFFQIARTKAKLVGVEKQVVSSILLMVEVSVYVLDNVILKLECSDLSVVFPKQIAFEGDRVLHLASERYDWSAKFTIPLMRFVYSSGVRKRGSQLVELMALPVCFELDISEFRTIELYEGVFFLCVSTFDHYDYSGYDLESELFRIKDKFLKLLESVRNYACFVRLIRDQLNSRPWVFITDKMSCDGFSHFDDMFGDNFIESVNLGNGYVPTYANQVLVTTLPPNCVIILSYDRGDFEILTRVEVEWGLIRNVYHFCEDFVYSSESSNAYSISFRDKQEMFDIDLPVCCFANYSKAVLAFTDLGLQVPPIFNFSKLFDEMPPQFIVRQFSIISNEVYDNVINVAKHMSVVNCTYPYVREKFLLVLR
jgi:hypothetical protein